MMVVDVCEITPHMDEWLLITQNSIESAVDIDLFCFQKFDEYFIHQVPLT